MSVWMSLVGKKVFVRLRGGRFYDGVVTKVDTDSKPLIFITMNDRFGKPVTFIHSEILEIKEEN
jgi:hypothetical protein